MPTIVNDFGLFVGSAGAIASGSCVFVLVFALEGRFDFLLFEAIFGISTFLSPIN